MEKKAVQSDRKKGKTIFVVREHVSLTVFKNYFIVTDKPIHSTIAVHKTTIPSVNSKSPDTTANTDTGRPVVTIPLVGKPTPQPESEGTTLIMYVFYIKIRKT